MQSSFQCEGEEHHFCSPMGTSGKTVKSSTPIGLDSVKVHFQSKVCVCVHVSECEHVCVCAQACTFGGGRDF